MPENTSKGAWTILPREAPLTPRQIRTWNILMGVFIVLPVAGTITAFLLGGWPNAAGGFVAGIVLDFIILMIHTSPS